MMQSFMERAEQIWSGWEIRFLVLLSLLLQIVLIVLGNRRKYGYSTWIGVVIWAAYLLSDSVAIFSLGTISTTTLKNTSASADKSNRASETVMVFWAPFLLVHLGGPDTITAFSLEDNELWLRHLFGFVIQVGLVFYLIVLSWIRKSIDNDPLPLTFIAIPVFVSGVLKYGEKTWVLWSSSSERFRKTLLPPARPEPSGPFSNTNEQYPGSSSHGIKPAQNPHISKLPTDVISEAKLLVTADWLFKILKSLYANLSLDTQDRFDGLLLLPHGSPKDAFKVIEIELGFIYDVLFSKLSVAYSTSGLILRSISLVSSSAAFLAFCIIVDKHNFSREDIIVTYVLVVGAICAEIYAIVMLIFSERTLLHLKKQQKGFGNSLFRFISASPLTSMKRKRWSSSMAQYNLISFCTDDKPAQYGRIQKFFGLYEVLEVGRYKTWEKVTIDLKEMIVENIKGKIEIIDSVEEFNLVLSNKGNDALEGFWQEIFLWSVDGKELDHSILIWHIATDLCYYCDFEMENRSPSLKARISKLLSNYMLYLLVMRPFMLPKGIGEIRYRDTCAEVKRFISQRGDGISSRAQACQSLLEEVQVDVDDLTRVRVAGKDSLSALFEGCNLAERLGSMELSDGETPAMWSEDEKWKVITGVWIEMLCYAASKCDWKFHIQELSRGGELLTHVSLLMVHLGLSRQFQVSDDTFEGGYFPS